MDQGQTLFIAVIVVILLVAVGLWLTMRRRRTDQLRGRFGDEYDRTVEASGDRARAEAALAEREHRVAALEIRPLDNEEHARFSNEWQEVKALFVDSPAEALLHADRMLANMMSAKGFPMADFDRRYEDLTVEHADIARHYRDGHDVTVRQGRGEASTENMRRAMKHYEALFDHLVADADPVETRTDRAPAADRIVREVEADREPAPFLRDDRP